MDGIRLQKLVNKGFRISAAKVGIPHQQYRPSGPSDPISQQNVLSLLPAAFSADNLAYKRPNLYGKATWTVLVDGDRVSVGDYLVGPGGTFLIVATQALLPIVAVECNRTLTFKRPTPSGIGGGAKPYGGDVASRETVMMSGFPASVLAGTKGEKSPTDLPDDVRQPWWAILLPSVPGVILETNDDVLDELGHRYKISSAELTDMGWRLTAMSAGT